MKGLARFAVLLEILPLAAFGCLGIFHPAGDPQNSANRLIRLLDFQGTYWIRNGIPLPPPLLIAGLLLSILLWRRRKFAAARTGTWIGIVRLGMWALIMLILWLVHVN
ncbi:MAG TPA: hypothetical protein PKM61_04755 [bacterium]|uniref:Uncharacterized protein n=1 Tax=candidate division TA06 bacterium ADurb.Bin417 TaxID=1852828 RepID=A0A1V5MC46_UNCT6|nr:MAG: hypothetical protein BWY73_01239 [candidate division TA06 bacterium ADurb.Bin417]HNS48819.1 hypothetical protein [bacterium]